MKIMRRIIKSCLIKEDPGDISTLLNPESVEEIKEICNLKIYYMKLKVIMPI